MTVKRKIIYLHGFLSSPKSLKAQLSIAFFSQQNPQVEIIAPQLANHPESVAAQLSELIQTHQTELAGFIGSSLGGYFATYCAAQTGLPAVLINPAMYPYLLLANYLGEHVHPYTQQKFWITDDFNQQLKSFEVENVTNLSIKAYVQTADETLDYRQTCAKFSPQQVCVIEGGDHAFQGYQDYLPEIADFLLTNKYSISNKR
ncbi:esterase YqiA [Catenovulum sp. 2E275]|uniref:YqiA/YcfP family alpha/beta fold hydrolase n=1 Tax=Catenovulum sp. 2E275 TaxID=2980497 RepID=UPI0021D0FB8C|nr:YqiA/YcfP family alpha/beta fold hydrolase [Catenovulum sp. 2E275]MCU4675327.1 esterase YqiA [Catenovulum sp. 2E275]